MGDAKSDVPVPVGPAPKTALCDLIGHTQNFVSENSASQSKHGVLLKFVLTGLLSGVAPPPLVMRMCPPLTTKNWAVYQPLLALGEFLSLLDNDLISLILVLISFNP